MGNGSVGRNSRRFWEEVSLEKFEVKILKFEKV